jgi:hypothetical protein
MDLGQQLALLLGDFSHLSPRLRHLAYDTAACGDRIEVRCSYPSFRGGEPTVNDFIDIIANHIVPFCLPRTEIQAAQHLFASGDHVKAGMIAATLAQKAKDLFIKAQKGSSRSGEAGEIILYILNEWILKAPQIVSKMYLKTNNNMPVHGTDGIHARFDTGTGKLHLYWGESKAHKTLNSALADALESIKEFVDGGQEGREIDIISAYPDFGSLDSATQDAFLAYLDPYSEQSGNRVPIFSCLLVHEFDAPKGKYTDDEVEQLYIDQVNGSVDAFIKGIENKIKTKGLEMKRFEFFLIPVPSVQGFRDRFQAKIGWPS